MKKPKGAGFRKGAVVTVLPSCSLRPGETGWIVGYAKEEDETTTIFRPVVRFPDGVDYAYYRAELELGSRDPKMSQPPSYHQGRRAVTPIRGGKALGR